MGSTAIETRLYIGGEWKYGQAGRTFPVINPATEEKIVDVHEADVADVDIAFAAAKAAFPAWRDLSMWERAAVCTRFAELLERDKMEVAHLESTNMGMPISAVMPCIAGAVAGIKHTVGLVHDIHGETSLNTPGFVTFTLRQPFGVCAAIIPWNVPHFMWAGKVIPCVAAGNTIILKSSEKAPLSSLKLAALAAEAGFPPGVVNVLSGFGHTVGNALSTHMGIRKISFTGSTRTAKLVLACAAKSNMKRVCCETGGKNPAVIFEDANLEEAADAVAASIKFNSGQICVSNSRIYVHKAVFGQFVELFKTRFLNIKAGNPLDETTDFGPQVDELQFNNILRLIDEARTDGAEILTGGKRAQEKGYYIQPTIFLQVPAQAQIMQTEVFGPVVAIQQFEDENHVIDECNDTEYGLHGTVFTKDISRAYRIVKAFEAGMITINCGSISGAYDMPFGGWKQSGSGRESGRVGLDSYFEAKTVTLKL